MSDSTPPPVPKKRLVRTLSLPAVPVPRLCPVPPGRSPCKHPHNFDNPVYMLTPVREPASSAPLLPLSQLSFDTPDEHLSHFFVNFKDRNAVSQSVEHRHLIFLRTMAHKMEEDMLLKEELSEKPVSTYQPQDFLLDEDSEPKTIAGRIYYSVHSPMFPGRTLGLRVSSP
uniref:PEAK family member 3 n=1 Tax=Knipowitschia caucasica TaxID=637954 RepID=A0AAV2KYW8_KNICA